jgi:hypothetical protein
MKTFVITYGFHDYNADYGDEANSYIIGKSSWISAENENDASAILKDQFETIEGIPLDIIKVELITN